MLKNRYCFKIIAYSNNEFFKSEYYIFLFKLTEIDQLGKSNKLDKNDGPCVKKLDETLNKLQVQRQAYHGRSFVGNHVNKMLKVSIKNLNFVYLHYQKKHWEETLMKLNFFNLAVPILTFLLNLADLQPR